MAANCTGPGCKCYEIGIILPNDTPPPPSFLIAAAVHIYLVAILGTLCNAVAVWCVATCNKTRAAVKVLLCSVFVPLVVICLVTLPMSVEVIFAVLYCDAERTPFMFRMITSILYSFLAQTELACIAVLAIIRAVAVWSPQRHAIRLRVAVILVICIFIHSFLSAVGMLGAVLMGYVQAESLKNALVVVYFFTNVMLPFIVTAVAYALMLFAMRQNKKRLAISDSRTKTDGTLDQATRAMVAVFISNLVFGFPHAVYHVLLLEFRNILELAIHMLFYTHFVVDPVVFVWYNKNYRQRVRERVCAAWMFAFGCCRTSLPSDSFRKISSTLPLWKSSLSLGQNSSSTGDAGGLQSPGTVLTQV